MRKHNRGYLMLLAIVFGAIFVTIFGALSGFVLLQNRVQNQSTAQTQALALAEAGLEYYKWFLAHNPGDVTHGTGQAGPYQITYNDPQGGVAGTISLSVVGNTSCGEITSIDITSRGIATGTPAVSRTLRARYARPTVAEYSYVLHESVWAGSDRIINGPYHSNNGIRMDGTTNAPVTSSVESWNCTSSFGCNPAQPTAPGVVGSGPNQSLWSDGEPQIDFADIAANFGPLRDTAIASGIYYPRFSTGTATTSANYWRGYHLVFNGDGTVTVRRVTGTTQLSVQPVNATEWNTDRALMGTTQALETRTIPANCGLIFIEDNVWVQGTIPSKVTLVAANVDSGGTIKPNIYLRNNILYGAYDGTDGLTAIAANNILITPDSPNNMTLNGIFVAKDGAFGRNYYRSGGGCNSAYEPRNTLTITGTTVSYKRTGTKWMNGCLSGDAGYQTRIDSYDRRLATDAPPFTPTVSIDYRFFDWREQ